DVGNLGIAQQRLQRAKAKNLVEQVRLYPFLLVEVKGHSLLGDDLLYDAGNRLARLTGIDARQLLQIQLGDQGPVYLRFVLFQIQQFHVIPSVRTGYSSATPSLSLPKRRQRAGDSSPAQSEGYAHRGLHVYRL